MAHSSEMRWVGASAMVAQAALAAIQSLNTAEEIYQELFEVFTYVGATNQLLADQFFTEIIAEETRSPAEANAAEVALVADLKSAIVSLHELYQALNNVAVSQSDRATDLRRMS